MGSWPHKSEGMEARLGGGHLIDPVTLCLTFPSCSLVLVAFPYLYLPLLSSPCPFLDLSPFSLEALVGSRGTLCLFTHQRLYRICLQLFLLLTPSPPIDCSHTLQLVPFLSLCSGNFLSFLSVWSINLKLEKECCRRSISPRRWTWWERRVEVPNVFVHHLTMGKVGVTFHSWIVVFEWTESHREPVSSNSRVSVMVAKRTRDKGVLSHIVPLFFLCRIWLLPPIERCLQKP